MEMKNLTHEEMMTEFNRRVDLMRYMVYKDMTDHRKIWDLINQLLQGPREDHHAGRAGNSRKEVSAMSPEVSDIFSRLEVQEESTT